jgi:hypothetical protein
VRSQNSDPNKLLAVMSTSASTAMRDGEFHHAAWVVTSASNGTAKVYLDGVEDTAASVSGTAGGTMQNFDHDLAIAAWNEKGTIKQFVDATLDEVALYPHPLSAARIQAHYDAAFGPPAPPAGTLILVR